MRFFVHDISAAQPAQITVLALKLFALYLQKAFLSILVFSCSCARYTEVPVEVVVIQEVWSNRFQIN